VEAAAVEATTAVVDVAGAIEVNDGFARDADSGLRTTE
jgi:hypothetical protein